MFLDHKIIAYHSPLFVQVLYGLATAAIYYFFVESPDTGQSLSISLYIRSFAHGMAQTREHYFSASKC